MLIYYILRFPRSQRPFSCPRLWFCFSVWKSKSPARSLRVFFQRTVGEWKYLKDMSESSGIHTFSHCIPYYLRETAFSWLTLKLSSFSPPARMRKQRPLIRASAAPARGGLRRGSCWPVCPCAFEARVSALPRPGAPGTSSSADLRREEQSSGECGDECGAGAVAAIRLRPRRESLESRAGAWPGSGRGASPSERCPDLVWPRSGTLDPPPWLVVVARGCEHFCLQGLHVGNEVVQGSFAGQRHNLHCWLAKHCVIIEDSTVRFSGNFLAPTNTTFDAHKLLMEAERALMNE